MSGKKKRYKGFAEKLMEEHYKEIDEQGAYKDLKPEMSEEELNAMEDDEVINSADCETEGRE